MVSRLSDGTVLPAREASRLKNENLELRKQLTELRQGRPAPVEAGAGNVADPVPSTAAKAALVVAATPPPTPAPVATPETEIRRALPVTAEISPDVSGAPRAEAVEVTTKTVRTYTVAQGDTLAGIARKFYRNSSQWPKIAEANKEALPDPTKLKVGMLLNIPE
jgi:nucleoid-associated protein YgaU